MFKYVPGLTSKHSFPFATALRDLGIEILTTGGTGRKLAEAGIEAVEVSSRTGFPEIMGGRVKTLHPVIHGGLLGRRGTDDDVMKEHGIEAIDLLVVMLRDLPVFETVIPSKIFEFLAQERPVILAAKGEIRRMIEEARGALVIDPEAENQLISAIEEVLDHPDEARERAISGRLWVEEGFIRDDLARKMALFLERVHAESKRT